MRAASFLVLWASLWASGCAEGTEEPRNWCEGGTASLGWGEAVGGPAAFPDDRLTEPDLSSPTGLRVTLNSEAAAWVAAVPENVSGIYGLLDGRDGWGTSSSVFLRFNGPVTGLEIARGESGNQDRVRFISMGVSGVHAVPFESWMLDGDSTVMVRPLRPLDPETRHAVVVTTDARGDDGACVAPSPGLLRVLGGSSNGPREAALVPRWRVALRELGMSPDQVSAGTVFTSGSRFETPVEIAALIEEALPEWSAAPECHVEEGMRVCEGTLRASDYRDGRVIDGAKAQGTWDLQVNLWLPEATGAPHPLVLFGHGLNSDRGAGLNLARVLAPLGIGVAAVDALHHGDHPTVADNITSLAVFDFIAVDPEQLTVDVGRLQANFLQSAFDKLQVLRMLVSEPDVDQDGQDDVDPETLGYYGESLGGIRASHVLALSGRLKVGVISVGGARLGTIIEHGADFGIIRVFMEEILGGSDEAARFYPVMQAAGDPGDPVGFATRVMSRRLVGETAPHVLLTAALGDFSVPNEASADLCRALDIPVLGPDRMGVGLVESLDEAGLRGNLTDGSTAAFFQLDRVSTADGDVVEANHENTPWSPEAVLQLQHFLTTWLEDGVPEIVDSYQVLGTPPLTTPPPG